MLLPLKLQTGRNVVKTRAAVACLAALLPLIVVQWTAPATAQKYIPLQLKSLSLAPTNGAERVGIVTLTGRAPAQGMVVRLRSSDPALVPLPATVTVPAGRKSVPFLFTPRPVATATNVTLTATWGTQRSVTLTLRPPGIGEMALTPDKVSGGENAIGTLRLQSPGSKAVEIDLSANDPHVTLQPAHLTLKKGETRAEFEALTTAITQQTTVKITAKANGVTTTATLTLTP